MNIFSRTLNVLVYTKIKKNFFFHNMQHLWSLSNMTRVHVDSVLPYNVPFCNVHFYRAVEFFFGMLKQGVKFLCSFCYFLLFFYISFHPRHFISFFQPICSLTSLLPFFDVSNFFLSLIHIFLSAPFLEKFFHKERNSQRKKGEKERLFWGKTQGTFSCQPLDIFTLNS